MNEEQKLNAVQTLREQIEYLHDTSLMIKNAIGGMGYSDAAANANALAAMSSAMADLIEIARIIKADKDRK